MLNRNSVTYQWIVEDREVLKNVSPGAKHEFESGCLPIGAELLERGCAL